MNVTQRRVFPEEIHKVISEFDKEVKEEYKLDTDPTSEVQRRVIPMAGIGHFNEVNDKIVYYISKDKIVATALVRHTKTNAAEITLTKI